MKVFIDNARNGEDDLQYYQTLKKEYIFLKKNKDRKGLNKWKRKHEYQYLYGITWYNMNDADTLDWINEGINQKKQ